MQIRIYVSRMSLSHQTSQQSQAFLRVEPSLDHVLILDFEASPNPPLPIFCIQAFVRWPLVWRSIQAALSPDDPSLSLSFDTTDPPHRSPLKASHLS